MPRIRWRLAAATGEQLCDVSGIERVTLVAELAINHHRYETIIAKARANPVDRSYESANGITYSVDVGPPVRVAFNPEGFLDNWSGVIYDPTGEVMQADGWDPASRKFRAPDRITKIFGGDLVACRHLWGDYYDCSFT